MKQPALQQVLPHDVWLPLHYAWQASLGALELTVQEDAAQWLSGGGLLRV
jgi:hypothetical protein